LVAIDLKYEEVLPLTKSELMIQVESTDPRIVANALYAASRYEKDWKWVQGQCLKGLNSPEVSIRWAAVTCLGDLAFHRRFPIDLDLVIPALELATQDPQIAEPAGFSLSLVRQALHKETL
jgi:hypothetical protein